MNRFKTAIKSRLAGKIAFGLTAMVAGAYTVPRVTSDTEHVNRVLDQVLTTADTAASEAGWDLANIDHARVDSWVDKFTTSRTLKPQFAIWLDRKAKYEPMISAKLTERSMPQDLIYLAMIESGFNPKARSPAAAGGLWQFISETGQRYGLTVNKRVDERNHPEKATDAALSYLTDLHERFGSWYLAAAAYNTGENRVGRLMRQVTGKEKGTDADYYRISGLLPRETREYVPMMIAAARIGKDPGKYGFADDMIAMTE
ncbi:MAG: lytic transglycosylase domain-containing protein [Gemmatimonadaceae bacterium]